MTDDMTDRAEAPERTARAYSEMTAAAVAMAKFALVLGWNAGVGKDDNESWDDEWRVVLYVETPAGPASWRISPDDQHMLEGLPNYKGRAALAQAQEGEG